MIEKTPDWLKRDPENGFLIGPDDCHYANEHQVCHYALLKLCGCGDPTEAYNFCREVLIKFDRRENLKDRSKEWIQAENAIRDLVMQKPDVAAHVISHLFTHLDLLEHGTSVGGSWLTERGEKIVDLRPAIEEDFDDS